MRAKYNGENILNVHIPLSESSSRVVALLPGWNDVPDEVEGGFLKEVEGLVDAGTIELGEGKRFSGETAAEVIAEIQECYDVVALRKLAEMDSRKTVVAAAEKQLEKIDAQGGKKDE